MEYKGNSWHETCFLCQRCQQPIGTKSFIPKDNNYFCVPCFEKQFAYQCCACKKVSHKLCVCEGIRHYYCYSSYSSPKNDSLSYCCGTQKEKVCKGPFWTFKTSAPIQCNCTKNNKHIQVWNDNDRISVLIRANSYCVICTLSDLQLSFEKYIAYQCCACKSK